MMKPIYKVYADRYVAAVIQGTTELAAYLSMVEIPLLDTLKVEPMTGQDSYPVTLIEYKYYGEISFLHTSNPDNLKRDLKSLGRTVLATYVIDKDFLGDPDNPGQDFMGILHHEHEEEE